MDRCDWAWLVLVISFICYVILCWFVLDPEGIFYLIVVECILLFAFYGFAHELGIANPFRWVFMALLAFFLFCTILGFITSYTLLKDIIGIGAVVVAVVVDAVVIVAILVVLRSVCPRRAHRMEIPAGKLDFEVTYENRETLQGQLTELKEQLSEGVITQKEYEQKKKKLLEKSGA